MLVISSRNILRVLEGNRGVLIQHSWAASDGDKRRDGVIPCCLELLPEPYAKSCFEKQALAILQQCLCLLLPSCYHQKYLL